ncbi:MAG: phosphate ABC transporter substrate-binding protein, partial [Spirochaetaceae bacterium]|nr:phosphate ABC transporter substrate-binding protein [Spirochaetaceae bacterium]
MKLPTLCTAGLMALCTAHLTASGRKAESTPLVYTIEIAGSTSVAPLMEMLAESYLKSNAGVKININGTGSSDGIKAASSGTSELGMSSRELSPSEKGLGLTERVIAVDGIAVAVHLRNPVTDLTVEQIRGIYAGEITRWEEITSGKTGRIAIVSREPGSGTRGAFEELVGLKDKLALGAVEFDGSGAVKAEISRNPDAIGYLSLGSMDSSIRAVSVGGAEATALNVRNGSYLMARPFIVLSAKSIRPESARFLEWILTPAGQE